MTAFASDVFEIEDFTNATDWENFIFLIEQFYADIHTSLLSSASFSCENGSSNCLLSDTISLSGQTFELHFYDFSGDFSNGSYQTVSNKKRKPIAAGHGKLMEDVSFIGAHYNEDNLFYNVVKWFGIPSFVVLKSSNSEVKDESEINSIKSACNIVSSNVRLKIPLICQISDDWRCFLTGTGYIGHDYAENQYNFDMIQLKSTPKTSLGYLSGLLELFKERAALPSSAEVTVSACYTYSLYDWTEFTVNLEDENVPLIDTVNDGRSSSENIVGNFFEVPVGTFDEVVSEVELSACWNGLSCSVVEESESYSDMTPLNAPQWWLSIRMNQTPSCILTSHVLTILKMSSYSSILHKSNFNRLESLSEGNQKLRLPDLVNVLTRKKWSESSFTIYADEISSHAAKLIVDQLFDRSFSGSHIAMDEASTAFKSAPKHSIVYDLAWLLCRVCFKFSNPQAMLKIWKFFVEKVRIFFDAGIYIPSVSVELPDFTSCLLNQNLQFLNCCTKRRLDRELRCRVNRDSSEAVRKNESSSSFVDSETNQEDEFFDCDDEESSLTSSNLTEPTQRRESKENNDWNDAWDDMDWAYEPPEKSSPTLDCSINRTTKSSSSKSRPPEGRLKVFKDGEHLLTNSEALLYIPVTQEPPIMTEYSLEKETQFLEQLGTTSDASELRMMIQSRTLLSDMECFKAANPGCILEDFIRWYSPRDWDPEDKSLSYRMTHGDNIWVKNWKMALPVPASRQKRLFDDTKEAEHVFEYLNSLNETELADLIMAPLLHHCYEELSNTKQTYNSIEMMKHRMRNDVLKLNGDSFDRNVYPFCQFLSDFLAMELILARGYSLEKKFCHLSNSNENSFADKTLQKKGKSKVNFEDKTESDAIYKDFISSLMESSTVSVVGASRGPVGDVICNLFSLANRIQEDDDYSFERARSAGPINDSVFPAPVKKEYVLSGCLSESEQDRDGLRAKFKQGSSDHFEQESSLPQRMYASVGASEFRVAISSCKYS